MFIPIGMFTVLKVPQTLIDAVDQEFEAALQDASMKHETAAHEMGEWSRQQLYQARRGDVAMDFRRLLMMAMHDDGRTFLEHFLPRVCRLAGVENVDELAAQVCRLVRAVNKRQPVKAGLRPVEQERKRA